MYHTIILSGGGTKGLCTLGALQYLYDSKRIAPDIRRLVGTSIGAIIAYFIAIGYTPIEIVVYLCSHNVLESLSLNEWQSIVTGKGIYDYSILLEWYRKMTLEKMDHLPTFQEVKDLFGKELYVCTYNFTKREKVTLSAATHPDMVCLDGLRMSSNLPFIFGECFYQDDEYIDGGIVENFCFSVIPQIIRDETIANETIANETIANETIANETIANELSPKKIVGIYLNVNPLTDSRHDALEPAKESLTSVIDKMYAVLMIPVKTHEQLVIKMIGKEPLEEMDLISIVAKRIKVYNFHLAHSEKLELFSEGYNTAKGFFEKILVLSENK